MVICCKGRVNRGLNYSVYLGVVVVVSWGGVRPSPLGTLANIWPIVPAPDDRWWWRWSSRWNENWQGKPKYWEKTCPSATLSTTNLTWPGLGSNPSCRGGKPATNRLSYGTALYLEVRHLRNYRTLLPFFTLSAFSFVINNLKNLDDGMPFIIPSPERPY
jgi:hypothetical protein